MEKLIKFLTIWSDWSISTVVVDGYWMNGITLIGGFIISAIVIGIYIRDVMPEHYPNKMKWKSIGIPIFIQLFLLWGCVQIPHFYSWIIGIIIEFLFGCFLNGSGIYESYLEKCEDDIDYKSQIKEYQETYNKYLTA